MKRFLIFAIGFIAAAFYIVLVWNIRPEVDKQSKYTVNVHVNNTSDYAEVYRQIRRLKWIK